MENAKNVGIWIRVSTDFQVKGDSPEHHEKRAKLYAEAKGWNIIKVYKLEAVSGKSVMDHAQTKQMLHDIQSGTITGLIFSKLARLARNTKELLEFSELFRKVNADLISLSENIDTSSPAGRLFYTMIAGMAEWERAEIAERVAQSVPIRAKLGKPIGGQAPYGYAWKNKELVIDENEAPVRKLMYELFLQHKRKKTVANLLNEKGYRTRKGALFSGTTVTRLLHDTTAKGVRIANYTKSLGDNKQWEYKPESEWIYITCPAIITEELWEKCNAILKEQEKENKRPVKQSVHLFTTVLYCGCGSKMRVPSKSKKYVCTSCRKNRIEKDDLEEIYYGNLKSFLVTDVHIKDYLTHADTYIKEKEEQLLHLSKERKKLVEQMDTLVDLHMGGEIPKEGFGRRYNPLDEHVKQLDLSIPELQAELDVLRNTHLNQNHLLHETKSLYDRWKVLDVEGKRQIVELITDRITIENQEITVRFCYNPSLFINSPDWQHNLTGSYWQ